MALLNKNLNHLIHRKKVYNYNVSRYSILKFTSTKSVGEQ